MSDTNTISIRQHSFILTFSHAICWKRSFWTLDSKIMMCIRKSDQGLASYVFNYTKMKVILNVIFQYKTEHYQILILIQLEYIVWTKLYFCNLRVIAFGKCVCCDCMSSFLFNSQKSECEQKTFLDILYNQKKFTTRNN